MEVEKYRKSFEIRKEEMIILRTIQTKMQDSLDMACKGSTPLIGVKLPPKFDIHCFYLILLESRKNFISEFLRLTESFMSQGMEIGATNNLFLNKAKELDPREFKIDCLKQRGFGVSEDDEHPLAILSKAVEYYGVRDPRSANLIKTMNR